MAQKKASSRTSGRKVAAGIGAGVALAAAAAAGAYFLYGSKNAARNRRVVKGWALKAKGEVLEQMEKVRQMDQKTYNKIVDSVTSRYKAIKSVDKAELAAMARELRGHWKSISKQVTKPAAKKAAKKGGAKKRKARR